MSDNQLKLAQAPDYEFKTITADQVRSLDITEITQQFNGIGHSDMSVIGAIDMSHISSINLDTLTIPTLSTATGITYTGPNNWTTTGTGYTIGAVGGGGGPGSYTITPNSNAATIDQSGTMSLRGEKADIDINGKSLMKTLERIEERLNLLQTNTELEAEWDELRELGERYRALEQRCRDKAKAWNTLKTMPPPKVD